MARSRQPQKPILPENMPGLRWLWALLSIGCVTLFFQLVPSLWTSVLAILDIRGWTWRTYAAICAVAIVALVAARAWQGSRDNR